MKAHKSLHIALAFDQNFVTPLFVLLTSIFYNNKHSKLIFHVIATGINVIEKEEIIKYVNKNQANIYFYEIDENIVKDFSIPENTHFTVATYYRLFFPALVPVEVEKLLYIDIDVVVVGDLAKVFEIDLGHFPVAAVVDQTIEARPELGIYEKGACFNAGILLINKLEWIKQNVTDKTIEFIMQNPEKIYIVDQDALNAVLIGNWYKLESKFNLMILDIPADMPRREYENYLKDKVIIHYNTKYKPWLTISTNRLKFLYHFYKQKSPKAKEPKYTDLDYSVVSLKNLFRSEIIDFYINNPFLVKFWRKIKP